MRYKFDRINKELGMVYVMGWKELEATSVWRLGENISSLESREFVTAKKFTNFKLRYA